jgi:hypothetical protein
MPARSVAISADARIAISGHFDGQINFWDLDWEYEFPNVADWHEGARPHLRTFLTLQTPYAAELPADRDPARQDVIPALTRAGTPCWTDEDFECLLVQLRHAGYGWLHRDGIRRELERMARQCAVTAAPPAPKPRTLWKAFRRILGA